MWANKRRRQRENKAEQRSDDDNLLLLFFNVGGEMTMLARDHFAHAAAVSGSFLWQRRPVRGGQCQPRTDRRAKKKLAAAVRCLLPATFSSECMLLPATVCAAAAAAAGA